MSFPAALGANLQGDATVEVAIENGDQPILPIASVSLEMRQRELCFDAFGGAPVLLFGGKEVQAPGYSYAQSFLPSTHPLKARFGTERSNPQYRTRLEERPFWDRNAEWMWMAFVLLIGVVGTPRPPLRPAPSRIPQLTTKPTCPIFATAPPSRR